MNSFSLASGAVDYGIMGTLGFVIQLKHKSSCNWEMKVCIDLEGDLEICWSQTLWSMVRWYDAETQTCNWCMPAWEPSLVMHFLPPSAWCTPLPPSITWGSRPMYAKLVMILPAASSWIAWGDMRWMQWSIQQRDGDALES